MPFSGISNDAFQSILYLMLNVCCEKDVWIYNNATAQSETLAMLFQVFLMSVDFNEVSR